MSGSIGKMLGGWVSGITQTANKVVQDAEDVAGKLGTDVKNVTNKVTTEVKGALDTFEAGVVQPVMDLGQRNQASYEPPVMTADAGSAQYTAVSGQLFTNGVSADDVVQGAAGDCYLLASMASVAETHPDLIQNAITANADGTYSVSFHEVAGEDPLSALGLAGLGIDEGLQVLHLPAGSQHSVTVDGTLPTDGGSEIYARSGDGETWPSVMEKGFAKWFGSYTAVGSGGSPGFALTALTGAPVDKVTPSKAGLDPLWTQLTEAASANQPMVAATPSSEPTPDIVGDHAYSVVGTSEVNGQRYVELRNPWGNTEPGDDGANDGVFQMKLEDFTQAFSALYIART